MKERKSITYIWKTLKVLIFFSFIYTSVVMIMLRSTNIAILILFAISFFMIFNKIENIDKRTKQMEKKQESDFGYLEDKIKELEEKWQSNVKVVGKK